MSAKFKNYPPRLANGRLVSAAHGCGRLWLCYHGCGAGRPPKSTAVQNSSGEVSGQGGGDDDSGQAGGDEDSDRARGGEVWPGSR